MSHYIKAFDPNHLIVCSSGGDDEGVYWWDPARRHSYNFLTAPDVDIMDSHHYGASDKYNAAHINRDFYLRKVNFDLNNGVPGPLFLNKPILVGELGPGPVNDLYSMSFYDQFNPSLSTTNLTTPPNAKTCPNTFNDHIDFHNGIWAGSFSGLSGTPSYYWGQIFPEFRSASEAYRQFRPLRTLIEQMDLNENLQPIATSCEPLVNGTPLGMSAQDYQDFTNLGMDACSGNSVTVPMGIDALVDNGNGLGIDNSKLLVVGLKGDNDIYGWVQKMDNFWWKLPHFTGGNFPSFFANNCPYSSTNFPSSPAACDNYPLLNTRALFKEVCNGEYYIDYYLAYPNLRVAQSSPLTDDGGIVPEFSRRVFTTNNYLNVILPPLLPLEPPSTLPGHADDFIGSPDYGYHIRKVNGENFVDLVLGTWTTADRTVSDLATFYHLGSSVTKVFYKSLTDNKMHYYWYDNSTGFHQYPMNWNMSSDPQVDGAIAADNYAEDKIFFRGNDAKLHYYYYSATPTNHWAQSFLSPATAPSNSAEDADQVKDIEATGSQVFFAGAYDDRVRMYYNNSGNWIFNDLLNSTVTSGDAVVGDIAALDREGYETNMVFYVSSNGKISAYIRNGSNSNAWTYSVIGQPSNSYEDAASTILPVTFNGDVYCFYMGYDNQVQYYTTTSPATTSSTWTHGYLGNQTSDEAGYGSSTLFFSNGVLYYFGLDQYMHRFYWDNHIWRHSAIVECQGNEFDMATGSTPWKFQFISNGNIVYPGGDGWIHEQWNQGSCQKCGPSTYVPGYKKSKNNDMDEGLMNLLNKGNYAQFQSDDKNYAIVIYPNPASDKLNILFKNNTSNGTSIKIMNTLGVVIKQMELRNNIDRYSIPVGEYPRGLYYVNLVDQTGKVLTTQKVSLY